MTTLNLNWRRVLIAAACTLGALPATANAADVSVSGTTLNYTAKPGERNAPRLQVVDRTQVIVLDEATLRPGAGCFAMSERQISCTARTGFASSTFKLGDGNDVFLIQSGQWAPATVEGEAGNDVYSATVSDSPHAVRFIGGPGVDTANYTSSPTGVTVTKNSIANDGRAGVDRDSVQGDVERLEGSFFDDSLTGADLDTFIQGEEFFDAKTGDDFMNGQRGFNTYYMGLGNDGADTVADQGFIGKVDYSGRRNPVTVTVGRGSRDDGEAGERDQIVGVRHIIGGAGNDTLQAGLNGSELFAMIEGNGGADTIGGTPTQDFVNGGAGFDVIATGAGGDTVDAVDNGGDSIDCGADADGAQTDPADAVLNCESNRRVGTLALAADRNTLDLAWTHPRDWKRLDSVQLQVRNADKAALGVVTIHPRSGKIQADGAALGLKRDAIKVVTQGRRVSARITLKPAAALAGQKLTADVTAVDTKGARQTEQRAAVIRVAS